MPKEEAYSQVDRDVPTFQRRKTESSAAVRVTRVAGSGLDYEDEYDIPTFLRKQAD